MNPFEPPTGDEPRLPPMPPAREAFGDRYFWLMVTLLGVFVVIGPLLVGWNSIFFMLFGVGVVVYGLVNWLMELSRRHN